MKKILVAIDESQTSERVLEKAKMMGNQFGGDVLVMTVCTRVVRPYHIHSAEQPGRTYTEYENPKEIADRVLAHAEEVFKGYDGKFETRIEFGEPADKILEVAEAEKPDLLVMGSRGLSTFKRIMLGSVSTKVLHHINCDVFVVRS